MRSIARSALLLLLVAACGDDDSTFDAGVTTPDAGVDAAPDAPTLEQLAIDETVTLTGLSAAVEVVRDNRGAPHIYARNLADAVRVQGYLMARDRFGQMEFLRRLTLGRLAELAPLPDLVAMDRDSRFLGYGRQGRAIYDSIPAGDLTKVVADSFVAGVNAYIDEVIAATDKAPYIPAGAETVYGTLFGSPFFGRWEPADIFAMARFQSTNLSYDPDTEILRTRALAGVREHLDASRQGAFVDMFSEVQARRVYTREGFPEKRPKSARAARRAAPRLPSIKSLDAALAYLGKRGSPDERFDGRGSNNWVVAGSKTMSGAPLLANDPHLSLVSPGVWWYVHLDTKRFGGASGVNVAGVAFASLPGVVLGFNEDLAWGATVTGFDVTDVYEEVVTDGAPPTVLWKGEQVPIQTIVEVIRKNGAADEMYTIEVVPHHGPIIPDTRQGGRALSVRYTGHEPSNELAYFLGLTSAKSIDEAWAAQAHFRVGSQNFVTVSRSGDIAWNTESRVPIRDPRAMTLEIAADGTVTGLCPTFVLPGTGEYDWTGDLPSSLIPKDRNPQRGFIATANQDAVGVTDDGNPCNQPDEYYLGGGFADGLRQGRIVERLEALTARGDITKDDMIALQAETQSQLGDTLRDPLVAILGDVTAASSTLFTDEEKAELAAVRTRLMAWTRKTPHGVGATDPAEIADSVATTIFNVSLTRIIPLAYEDEVTAIGVRPPSDRAAALLERALTQPELLATGSALWDNLTTGPVETKEQIVGRGILDALAYLRGRLGEDMDQWRWGRLHTVRFTTILPFSDPLSIPPPGDPMFPDGFPRHGDFGAVDVGNYGMWSTTNFMHGSGPSQRLVVEMLPGGPRAYNALPGGQSIFPGSPHHDDEARLYWSKNLQPPVNFVEADVVRNAEARLRFMP
jgi:penicillin amidase